MRRWANLSEPEELPGDDGGGGGLLRRPGLSSTASSEMPWEGRRNWPLFEFEESSPEEDKASLLKTELPRTIRAALGLALFPLLLIILEDVLYPPLTRSLALFSLVPRSVLGGLGHPLIVGIVMIVFLLGEAPFTALLTSLIAEMYDQKASFLQTLLLHPRIQSARVVLGVGVLLLGVTGMVQPLFLLWGIGSLVWGTALTVQTSRAIHGWKDWGGLVVPAAFALYQALGLLVYFVIR
jgi:hypothetical protein